MRNSSLLVLALVAFTVPAVPAVPAAALGYDVCPSGCAFDAIQPAIDAAPAGGTVRVGPGLYEGWVIVDRGITLLGAQAGVAAPGRTGPESVIEGVGRFSVANMAVLVRAGSALDGFTVRHSEPWNDRLAVWVWSGGPTPTRVLNNVVEDASAGIDVGGNGPTEVAFNLVADNNWEPVLPDAPWGVGIRASSSLALSIHDNVITPHHRAAMLLPGGYDVDIARNAIQGGRGIEIAAPMHGIAIHDNAFEDIVGDALLVGGQMTRARIERNTFDGVAGHAVHLAQELNAQYRSGEILVQRNVFDAVAGAGLRSTLELGDLQTIDARENWWGTPLGPDVGDVPFVELASGASGEGIDASTWCATRACDVVVP